MSSAVRQLTIALIKAGMDPVEATVLIARAGVEMAPPADVRTPGARRQAAYRERNKASPNVTEVTASEPSPSVTNRNETSQSDAASLSIDKKDSENKKKRESARAAALPDDWRPDAEQWRAALDRLGSAPRAEQELQKFKNHALDKGRVSKRWGAAWANWVDRAIVYAGGQNGNGTSTNRTAQITGSAQTRDTSIIAGMGRALERRRAARDPAYGGREDVPERGGSGTATGDDADPGAAEGDDGPSRQLALLPVRHAGQ